jgi:GT2 family glycosyltransferase
MTQDLIASGPPTVSVVIPFRRGELTDLSNLLRALGRQSLQSIETIVVDNNERALVPLENDGLPRTRWVYHGGAGAYSARNAGAELASGLILAFTDADCIPSDRWLEFLVQDLESRGLNAVIAGAIVVTTETEWSNVHEDYDRTMHHRQSAYVREGFGATANFSMYRSLFERVGQFDERFLSGGDRDWCVRACAAGAQVHLNKRAVVFHPARRSLRELCIKNRRGVGGETARIRKAGFGLASPVAYQIARTPRRFQILWGSTRGVAATRRFLLAIEFLFLQGIRVAESVRLAVGALPERR